MRYLPILILFSTLLLSACSPSRDPEQIIVGTIAGPETELVQVASNIAKERYNLRIKVIPFSDYIMPNRALSESSIDMNIYQHLPYLKAASKSQHYQFAVIGKTFIYPMGIYSKTVDRIDALKSKAVIALPNDPSNEARALLLLEKAGLITLKTHNDINATITSILNNPKQLQFKELDAAQLPRVLHDVDAAVINTNYALPAGLKPKRDAIFIETKDSLYANIIVVREKDKQNPKLLNLVKALNSPEVLKRAEELFKGQAIPAW